MAEATGVSSHLSSSLSTSSVTLVVIVPLRYGVFSSMGHFKFPQQQVRIINDDNNNNTVVDGYGFGPFIDNKSEFGGFGTCSNVVYGWFVPNNHHEFGSLVSLVRNPLKTSSIPDLHSQSSFACFYQYI